MTAIPAEGKSAGQKSEFFWNLILGFLVSALSVLTAAANYNAYQSSNLASDLEAEGDRLLADANTGYIQANQYIILDYTMFDGEFLQRGVDDFAADYYKDSFSVSLQASIDRGSAFDEHYYAEMYSSADQSINDAFASIDAANAESDREAGFQLAMLIASVGLAFAAYASLLNNANFLRTVFTVLSFILLALGAIQFFSRLA